MMSESLSFLLLRLSTNDAACYEAASLFVSVPARTPSLQQIVPLLIARDACARSDSCREDTHTTPDKRDESAEGHILQVGRYLLEQFAIPAFRSHATIGLVNRQMKAAMSVPSAKPTRLRAKMAGWHGDVLVPLVYIAKVRNEGEDPGWKSLNK